MEPREIAAAIGVELVGRLPHGEGTGAYEAHGPDGIRIVLKVFTGDVLDLGVPTRLTDALRARGYPVPEIHAAGVVDGVRYELQELLPGEPLEQPTPGQVVGIRALVEKQRDARVPGRAPWLDDMISTVLDGRTGYCEHAAMAEHSDETRTLLDRLRRIADRARNADVSDQDVVHYDFSPYNILADGDDITGVVDWEGATSGDAAFDLVTLATYTYDYSVRDQLLAVASASTDPRAVALYAAHMVLRSVDWALRHHDEASVEWFFGIGTDLLAATGAG